MACETYGGNCDARVSKVASLASDWLHEPHWYAIRTRSRHEKMVSDQLEKLGIENFLPLVKKTRQWTDRTKEVQMPVFSGYSFVRMVFSSPARLRVLQTHGVAGLVGVNNVGTAIPDSEIQDVRALVASSLPFEEHPYLRVGQRVRIKGGSLDGVEGILSARDEGKSLVVSVELIQRSLSVRISGYAVEPV
ncbi:MAG: UpxY family transcription antiterminator [Candidatus Sulfotelmatobacter sp.]|jgi:transcription antitermination factor NusG